MVITVNCTDSDPLIAIANGDISFTSGNFYTINVEPSLWQQYIKLEDKKVGKILANAELTDAEGNTISNLIYYDGLDYYLSTTKAASVNLKNYRNSDGYPLFCNNTDVTSFDEFQYFTSTTSMPAVNEYGFFEGCTSLKSITLPSTLTTVGIRVFYGCTALTAVTFTGAIKKWEEDVFGGNVPTSNITLTIASEQGGFSYVVSDDEGDSSSYDAKFEDGKLIYDNSETVYTFKEIKVAE